MRYKPITKHNALTMWLIDGESILRVCNKFECTERSLWRWKKRWDGTKESLKNLYCRPHTPDPKRHTEDETADILSMRDKYPNAGWLELHGRLRAECAYSRSYWGLRHFVLNNNLFGDAVEEHIRKTPQPYDTPTMIGVKMQCDIKYVPTYALKGEALNRYHATGERLYQFTMIDECSREVFEYAYQDMSVNSAVDFLKRSIIYYGYVSQTIQTDNGLMFRLPYHAKKTTAHAFVDALKKCGIVHQLIAAYTPEHNGKVERQHRKDNERNYRHNKFGSVKELNNFLQQYICDNNEVIPNTMLRCRHKKARMQTPAEKRAECLEILKEEQRENEMRWLKGRRPA